MLIPIAKFLLTTRYKICHSRVSAEESLMQVDLLTLTWNKGVYMKGFGKISKVNNLPKTKIIVPHVKGTKRGIKLIKSYARSK